MFFWGDGMFFSAKPGKPNVFFWSDWMQSLGWAWAFGKDCAPFGKNSLYYECRCWWRGTGGAVWTGKRWRQSDFRCVLVLNINHFSVMFWRCLSYFCFFPEDNSFNPKDPYPATQPEPVLPQDTAVEWICFQIHRGEENEHNHSDDPLKKSMKMIITYDMFVVDDDETDAVVDETWLWVVMVDDAGSSRYSWWIWRSSSCFFSTKA